MGVLGTDNPCRLACAIKLYFITSLWPSEIKLHCTIEKVVLIHYPADDKSIRIVWWSGAKKVIGGFDELVL